MRNRLPCLALMALLLAPGSGRAERLVVPRVKVKRVTERLRRGGTWQSPYVVKHLEPRHEGDVVHSQIDYLIGTRQVTWRQVEPFDRVAETIKTLRSHKSWRTRRAAVDELLWYPSERVEEALIRALRDPILAVRFAAVEGLAQVGTNRSVDPLMQSMRDTPGPVRDAIALTLRKLTGEDYGRHLDRWRRWQKANKDVLR